MLRKNIECIRCCYFAISVVLLLSSSLSSCSRQQGEPHIKISLQELDLSSQKVILHVVVTNVGKHPLVIPRLQENKLKQYWKWGGWTYIIQEKNHSGFFFSSDKRAVFTRKDLITLQSEEYLEILVNIADMEWMSPYSGDPHPKLINVEGEYTVRFELNLGEEPTGDSNIPFLLHWTVWQGSISSNTITFVINHQLLDSSSQEEKKEE